MAEAQNGETVQVGGTYPQAVPGTAGVNSQIPGAAATVSNLAGATGGIAPGNIVEVDLDAELYRIKGDDTPLTQLALRAKKIKVASPEVEHFMIDEPRSQVMTTKDISATTTFQAVLPLDGNDLALPRAYSTLLVKGVDGYTPDGQTKTPGKDLMLFVTGIDPTTQCPLVRAINGPKANATDEFCTVPAIPEGTTLVLLSNALYETQKEVEPAMITPQPTLVYLQKRGMNQIVSDYFESQKKHIPFSKALIAEQAIMDFKVKANRTFWAGRAGKFSVQTKLGTQLIYTTEGIRWQFKKELMHTGKWTVEEIVALAKMAFTGEDVPKNMILLAGKNFLENIQCIDYSKHPEVQITSKVNPVGWTVTNFHTVFGDIEIKHDPTLDRLGWSNSGALLAPDRLVHYTYSAQHSTSERVEGEEATREAILVWDALALKGSCHIWIDGESEAIREGVVNITMWDSEEAPADATEGSVYYLLEPCPGINASAVKGQMWQMKEGKWQEYNGAVMAK